MSNPPAPGWDPLQRSAALPLREIYYPLGFAVEIRTNAEAVLAAAEESWRGCEKTYPDAPLQVRVLVAEETTATAPPPPRFRSQGHLLVLAADHSHFAACDLEAGFAAAWLSAAAVGQQRSFRFHYLEALTYSLLTYRRLTPVHASAVALNGRAVLLSGEPGAGKSCLAYACARADWTFVADDVAYLDRRSDDGVVLGRPRFLRFKDSASELFPELAAFPPAIDVDGGRLIEVDVDQLPGIAVARRSRAGRLVFLDRCDRGAAELSPIEPREALGKLLQELPRYGERVDREQVAAVERLVARGAYRLRYADFEGALESLHGLMREDETSGAVHL